MTNAHPTDESRDRAALHALGLLAPDEAADLERHLAEGCEACREELDAFAATAAEIALAAPPVPPRAELRARLLAEAQPAAGGFHFTLAGEGVWEEVGPGVARKGLAGHPSSASRSFLIRLQPGAMVDVHHHDRDEHCYVIAGDLHVAGRRITQGDYHRADAGSVHAHLRSDGGCLLLIVESQPAAP